MIAYILANTTDGDDTLRYDLKDENDLVDHMRVWARTKWIKEVRVVFQ